MSEKKKKDKKPARTPLAGMLAEYDSTSALMKASEKVRDAGFENWDTFTPFPVHGIDPAMGIKPTFLPWIVLAGGLTGCTTGVILQWWTNAVDYPWIVSGKPFWSLPANIPVIFELTILLSAFCALGGMLALNKLPHPSHPLDLKERFSRATDDRFFIYIESVDPKFDEDDIRELLEGTHALAIETVDDDTQTEDKLPRGIIYALIILTAAAGIPFALAARARASESEQPRIHIIPDMDFQQKFKAQAKNVFYEDQRAMRGEIEGTVAVGEARLDDHFYRGKQGSAWARTFPSQVEINDATMARGKERYDVFCAPCHGLSAKGDGMVHRRTDQLAAGDKEGWVPPTNIHQDYLREQPVGELFNSITNGVRNMPAYGRQIPPEDRWAIILYVRALQRSQNKAAAGGGGK